MFMKKFFTGVFAVYLGVNISAMLSNADEITGGFRFVSPAGEQKNRWKVEGDRALFIDQNVIEVSPVRATVSISEGEEMIIKMPWARLNRNTKDVWTNASIEVIKGKSRLTGVGLRWNTHDKNVKILKKVRMEIDSDELKTWKDF
jgi:LPS export ABC transporter protein LptC